MARNGSMEAFEDRLESLKESVRNLVDISSERADAIKHKMADVKDSVVASSKSGINRMGGLIKDHPIVAIGIAFGLGYFAVRMLRR